MSFSVPNGAVLQRLDNLKGYDRELWKQIVTFLLDFPEHDDPPVTSSQWRDPASGNVLHGGVFTSPAGRMAGIKWTVRDGETVLVNMWP